MTTIDMNVWGVLLSGVSSMLIGAIYYSDSLFGKDWKRLANIDGERFNKEFPKLAPLLFLGAMFTAFLVGLVDCYYEKFYVATWMQSSLMAALIIWLAVSVSLAIHNALDQRPLKLTVISIGNRFFSLLAIGLILGWLHP